MAINKKLPKSRIPSQVDQPINADLETKCIVQIRPIIERKPPNLAILFVLLLSEITKKSTIHEIKGASSAARSDVGRHVSSYKSFLSVITCKLTIPCSIISPMEIAIL